MAQPSEPAVSQFRFEFAARSDKGLVRSTNEDAFGTLPEDGIVVVADGMGGYQAGEVASQIAVDVVLRYLVKRLNGASSRERCLEQAELAIEEANLAIWRAAEKAPELRGMGTTVVLGVFRGGELGFAWVGDSRLYLLRTHRLVQLTTDHTLVQELVDQHLFPSVAEAVAAGVGENVLTRALGADEPFPVDNGSLSLAAGDIYLFCSDGLNHLVPAAAIERVLRAPGVDLGGKADRLVRLAREAGGLDNITVVLAAVIAAA
jgi:serine/threonine protein phosphatase PrpC